MLMLLRGLKPRAVVSKAFLVKMVCSTGTVKVVEPGELPYLRLLGLGLERVLGREDR